MIKSWECVLKEIPNLIEEAQRIEPEVELEPTPPEKDPHSLLDQIMDLMKYRDYLDNQVDLYAGELGEVENQLLDLRKNLMALL